MVFIFYFYKNDEVITLLLFTKIPSHFRVLVVFSNSLRDRKVFELANIRITEI